MDVLSDVLRAVRLTGALYFEVDAAHPWISMNPSMNEIGAAMIPEADYVIPFHVMMRGQAWAMPEDRSVPPTRIRAGDVVMFPLGASHVITSDPGAWDGPPADVAFYQRVAASGQPFTLVEIGGDGEKAKFVCGYLGCDASPFNPLIGALPSMVVVEEQSVGSDLITELVEVALREKDSGRAGGHSVVARLAELMFVQALRGHMVGLPEGRAGWLSGLRDEHVGRALQRLHGAPERDWSVEELAREAGLSRSAFAARFKRFIGESPMRYLGQWRMQLASNLLDQDQWSVAQVAEHVGYRSEAAFRRAFRRYVGVPPGRWRARARSG